MKKKISIIISMAACFCMLLVGCGKKLTVDDAPAYVKSALDACYKGEFEAYMEFTNSTEEEAQALYNDGIDANLEASGITDINISQELQDQYRQLFIGLLGISKYTVGEAKEDGDGFTVEVSVEPFIMFDSLQQDLINAMNTEEAAALSTGDEINTYIYQKMYDLMSSKLNSPEYGDPQTVTVHIQPDDEGIQTIDEDDLVEIDTVMYASILE